MKKAGYDSRLSAGAVAAGGVLGVLIPPSVLLIFYAALTEVSAGKMLVAGVIPGILSTVIFMAGIWIISRRTATGVLTPPRETWGRRFASLADAWQVLLLFLVVLGGIYLGFVTPTEAGAVGAFVAFVMLLASRQPLSALKPKLLESCRSSITTTVMILFTMIGAEIGRAHV